MDDICNIYYYAVSANANWKCKKHLPKINAPKVNARLKAVLCFLYHL